MKFETNKPVKVVAYHGTQAEIEKFEISPNTIGLFTGNNGGAVFFTDNKNVAIEYSKGNYLRQKEDEINWSDPKCNTKWYIAKNEANEKAFCYEVELDIKKPLVLDIKEIESKNFEHISNGLDSYKLNHLINILQNRMYQYYFATYDIDIEYAVLEKFQSLFGDYNEELDEYIEKDYNYDCIIIENCIDSVTDASNYMPSTIFAVLDDNIININKKIFNEV